MGFDVRRGGTPVGEVRARHAVHTGITYQSTFEEWEAGTGAGLNMWLWERNQYPIWFKARTIAWYRGHVAVETHSQDAALTKSEQEAKKNRRKR